MAIEDVIKEVAEKLAEEADVRAVFGEPLKLESRSVIPVAIVTIRIGAEMGAPGSDTKGVLGRADLAAQPAGFICEEDGQVVFKAIEAPRPAAPAPEIRQETAAATPAPRRRRSRKLM